MHRYGHFSGLRSRLLQFAILAVLPALGFIFYMAFHSWKLAEAYTQDEAMRLVRLASTDYERLVEGTRHFLGTLTRLAVVRSHNAAACSALFSELKGGYPHYANLGAIGPDGYVFCSATPLGRRTKGDDRSYFQRAVETRGFVTGDYQIGRITGKPVLVFGYPGYSETGRLESVVFAALDLTWLNQLAAKARLPPGSSLALIDAEGTTLNHYPDPQKWIGTRNREAPLVQTILANRAEGTVETTGVDGARRLYSFAPLFDTPQGGRVYLALGIPRDVARAELRQVLARTLGGLAVVMVLTLIAAWYGGAFFLLRQVQALIGAARRLGKGDLSVRSNLAHSNDELGELARSFDEMAANLQDREERAQRAENAVQHLAYHDPLTELGNRLLLVDRLNQAIIEAKRHNRNIAVICFDMDRFQDVNNSLGHGTGDLLLKAVAERLATCVRPGDTVARMGDDEFGVVLNDIAHTDDINLILRKLKDCFAQSFGIGGHDLFVTVSAGIALYPLDGSDPDQLVRNAEAAMYRAVEQGGNNLRFYSAEMSAKATERLRLETGLHQTLAGAQGELLLHYQPQTNLKTGVITGVEALVRWRHPEFGLVSPATFIPIAEETGQILPIGEWVLRTACAQAKAWLDDAQPLRVAVNLSVRQFLEADLVETVRQVLKETALDPRYLSLEITESMLVRHSEPVNVALRDLKTMGISIEIDDFGTGYSSLGYLKRFPIDALKIDQSFIRDITEDRDDATIVVAIIAMAHGLGMSVIAEGVETAEQLAFLREHGCDDVQGYLLGKPMPAEMLIELLNNKHPPVALKTGERRGKRTRKTK